MSFENGFVLRINKKNLPRIPEIVFILFFAAIPIKSLLLRVFGVIGITSVWNIFSIVYAVITGILLVLAFINAGRERRKDTIILFIFIALFFMISYLLNPDIGTWFADEEYGILNTVIGLEGGIFAGGVVGYVVIRVQRDVKRIYSGLKICSFFWIVYLLIIAINRISRGYFEIANTNGQIIQRSYHMSFGYYCAFISILNFILWKREKKILNIIIGIVFAALSIAFGARGVIIVYAIFIIALIWIALRETTLSKKILISIIVAIVAGLIVSFFTEIVIGIQQLLSAFGVSDSRTLASILSGEVNESNGRDQIWTMVSDMIRTRFPLGYGAYGERPIVGLRYGWGYSHNFFLETIVALGIVGVIIDVFLIVKAALIINNTTNKDWNLLFVLFFSNCGMLLISNSFWYDSYFWATIAIGVTYMEEIRQKNQNAQSIQNKNRFGENTYEGVHKS